jgi:DNA-binding XRE family transcriptional regulator
MATKISTAYQTISNVSSEKEYLYVTFVNGDVAKLKISAVTPEQSKKIWWQKARIEAGGMYIYVPADPKGLEIPWHVIRRLTDQAFAREMVDLAAKQARQIGERLRELREKRGLTQAKVASIAGIEPANLSRIENGYFDISASTLWKILAAMGCSPRDLASEGKTAGTALSRSFS